MVGGEVRRIRLEPPGAIPQFDELDRRGEVIEHVVRDRIRLGDALFDRFRNALQVRVDGRIEGLRCVVEGDCGRGNEGEEEEDDEGDAQPG